MAPLCSIQPLHCSFLQCAVSIILHSSKPVSVSVSQGNLLPANSPTSQATRISHLKSVHLELALGPLIFIFYFPALSLAPTWHGIWSSEIIVTGRDEIQISNLAHIGISWVWVTLLAFSLVLQLLPCTPVSSSLLPFHPSLSKDLKQVHNSTVQSAWTTSPLLLQRFLLRKPGTMYRAHSTDQDQLLLYWRLTHSHSGGSFQRAPQEH